MYSVGFFISNFFRYLSKFFLKNFLSSALAFCFFGNSIDILLFFSGNYGGALGANALAKGLEGNKSLRVPVSFTSTSYLSVVLWGKSTSIV